MLVGILRRKQMRLDVDVADGKYVVHINEGKLTASRYGNPWRDLTGDNLIYWLAVELAEAREIVEKLRLEGK
jgi:hypothetical protein